MKLKVYNKKVIGFVWENMMTSFFVADGPSLLQKPRSSYFPIQSLQPIMITPRHFDVALCDVKKKKEKKKKAGICDVKILGSYYTPV